VNYLLLTPELFVGDGGIARIMRLYLKGLCELAREGETVRFLALNDRLVGSPEMRRYSNERLAEWGVYDRRKLAFVRAAFRIGLSSDVIVCGHIGQLPLVWLMSKLRPGLSYFLVAHGIEVWRPFSFIERRALKGSRRIFCVSDFTRRQIVESCPMLAEKAVVLYNALDPFLDPKAPASSPESPDTILTISRLTVADSYKGIDHLVKAMPAVCEEMPGTRLKVVGRGDGLPGLQALAKKLNIHGNVEFAGYRSDMELKVDLERCRLFALPSEKEGFGLVFLEAMAHGRPCLGARSGGVPEIISPETGVLVEYGDVNGIAGGIIGALRRNWSAEAIIGRARQFSYLRFKERLGSLLLT
jgi:phosphatidyl-myo-inositol dimannoside synthase